MSSSAVRLLKDGDPETGMGPSSLTAPESFLVDNPSETIHTPFTNAQGNVTAGVWECSPSLETFERYGVADACAPGPIAYAVYAGHRYARELDAPDIGDAVPFKRELTELAEI